MTMNKPGHLRHPPVGTSTPEGDDGDFEQMRNRYGFSHKPGRNKTAQDVTADLDRAGVKLVAGAVRHDQDLLEAIRNRDGVRIARYLRAHESRDPVLNLLGDVFDPDPMLDEPIRAHLKKRRRGRPARLPVDTDETARRVELAHKKYAKVEAGIADLQSQGISRSTAFRTRKRLGLNKGKLLN